MEYFKKINKSKNQFEELFFNTGNFYYYLIAQDINKIIEIKRTNELNNQSSLEL